MSSETHEHQTGQGIKSGHAQAGVPQDSESFAELFEKSLPEIRAGAVVQGTILRADPENVLVDIGFKS